MASQASQYDLTTAFLNQPVPICYGLVRGAGNLVLQHELSDKTLVGIYLLGEGPWDSLVRLWIRRKAISLPDTTKVHFHPGGDGEIGSGMSATSTGGDQKVDAFFADVPGVDYTTFSRYAYVAVKAAPDPGAPSAELEILGDYQALRVRIFDSSGNQTAFQWTQNWVWCGLDYHIRKFILREAKVNQPLTIPQLGRQDWSLLSTAAAYCDADIGGGVKRFSDGGLVWLDDGLTADRALEQLLLMCRGYILELNGKLSLNIRQSTASAFTFNLDNIAAGSFKVQKSQLRSSFNQIQATYRDYNLASGSSDHATRFQVATPEPLNHESHQLAVGFSARGMARIPKVTPLALDFGVNTPERVWRLSKSWLLEELGEEADPGVAYVAPFEFELDAFEDSLAVIPGDTVTIDKGISEEFGGLDYVVLEVIEHADGTRHITGKQKVANAYPDSAPSQQTLQAPNPGTGVPTVAGGGSYSYRTTKNVLRASDAGANATIYVEDPDTSGAFVNRIAGIGDLSINAGTITGQAYSTLVHVYYTDTGNPPTGGSKTFGTASTREEALNGFGRFYLGSIIMPAAGTPDTIGNNDAGAGAQIGGGHIRRRATVETLSGTGGTTSNAGNGIDGDWATYVQRTKSGEITNNTQAAQLSGFGVPAVDGDHYYYNLKLKLKFSVSVSNESDVPTANSTARIRYSPNNGASWTTVREQIAPNASLPVQIDVVALPAGTDPSDVLVEAFGQGHLGGSNNDGGIIVRGYEAELEADW
jgi:hypothetical protein